MFGGGGSTLHDYSEEEEELGKIYDRVLMKRLISYLIPVPDLKATNSFSRISDSGDLLRISSRLIQIWYETL